MNSGSSRPAVCPTLPGFTACLRDEQMVAGGMTFYFAQANVLHTQYLAADLSIRSYSPAAYLYYRMLCLAAGWAATPCPGASRRRNAARC